MSPFEGLRVVDLSPTRVGAQISQLFADFGADVIQVEPPGGASIRRHAAYPFWARGKRSIALDINADTEADVLRDLARTADVFIETQHPGTLDALGLGYDALSSINPRLIYVSVTGFGRRGPFADLPGYEGIVMAKLGVFGTFQRMSPHAAPPFVNVPFASFSASQVALHGTLAALIERERSGAGQWVETNLLQAFTSLDTWAWFEHLIRDRWPDAFQSATPYDAKGRPMSPLTFMLMVCLTSDGHWLQFASVASHLYAALMKALGLAWMFTDPEWQGMPLFGEDADKRQALWTKMLEAARTKTLAEWEAIFDSDPNVFAEQFRNGPGALDHPQLLHDDVVLDINDTERGPVRQPSAIVKASVSPAELGRSAPMLDEQADEIRALASEARRQASGAQSTPISSEDTPKTLPLEGIIVLELATMFAAPHGTTMLTDLGARVIKVEPLTGDNIRWIIPFPESGAAKVMQGKESIAIDLSTDEAKALIRTVASKVDVVVQGYRAGAMNRMGLDYASIRATNPDVIYVNAPGYGVDGPYGAKPAYAPSIGAACGIPLANVGLTVPESPDLTMAQIQDGARRLSAASALSNAQADGFAALGVATAILFGIAARDRGAGGQELFSSMLNTGAHAMSAGGVTYPNAPVEPAPSADLRGLGPLYRIYDAADGHVFLAAPTSGDWAKVSAALGVDVDQRFDTEELRSANAAALAEALAGVFATKPATAWEAELLAKGVACVALNPSTIESLLFDESVGRASGYVSDCVHPVFEEHPRLAPYLRFSRSITQALPGVTTGQQTDDVLRWIGVDDAAIAALRSRSIVG